MPHPSPRPLDSDRHTNGAHPQLAMVSGRPDVPVARLRFALPHATPVAAYVTNSAGQLVHTICQQELEPGEHLCLWDGRGANGQRMSAGTYTLRLEAADRVLCVRVVTLS